MRKASKVLRIFLVSVLLLTVSGCGDKSIKLTKDNFKDYFNLTVKFEPVVECSKDDYGTVLYQGVKRSANIEAVSQNFNYEDVNIKIIIIGTAVGRTGEKYKNDVLYTGSIGYDVELNYKEEIELTTDIAGNGEFAAKDHASDLYDSGVFIPQVYHYVNSAKFCKGEEITQEKITSLGKDKSLLLGVGDFDVVYDFEVVSGEIVPVGK